MAYANSQPPSDRSNSSASIVVRRYRPGDEDVVVDLWARASRIAHAFVPGEGTGERERKMREVYLVHADNWVAEVPAGSLTGSGAASSAAGEDPVVVGLLGMLGSEIGGLFVDPDAQGLGIGRRLVAHARELHGSVTLDVYERNSRARAFYEHLGFVEERRHTEDETALVLITLRLPALDGDRRDDR